MKPTGFHQWDLFSSAYNNGGDLPTTGLNLTIPILVVALVIMVALTLREMSDQDR